MATLTVRNLEDEVVKQLRVRAAANGRSAEAEHRELLRRALLPSSEEELQRRWAVADQLEEFQKRTGGRGGPTGAELIRESRIERTARLSGVSEEDLSEIM